MRKIEVEYFALAIPGWSEGRRAIRSFLEDRGIALVGPEQDMHVTLRYFGRSPAADRSVIPSNDVLGTALNVRVIGYGEYRNEDGAVLNQGLLVDRASLGQWASMAQNGDVSHVTLAINKALGARAVDTAKCDFRLLPPEEQFVVPAFLAVYGPRGKGCEGPVFELR